MIAAATGPLVWSGPVARGGRHLAGRGQEPRQGGEVEIAQDPRAEQGLKRPEVPGQGTRPALCGRREDHHVEPMLVLHVVEHARAQVGPCLFVRPFIPRVRLDLRRHEKRVRTGRVLERHFLDPDADQTPRTVGQRGAQVRHERGGEALGRTQTEAARIAICIQGLAISFHDCPR